ncbi:MAG: hypothetical protein ACOC2J_04690 [bacterium]
MITQFNKKQFNTSLFNIKSRNVIFSSANSEVILDEESKIKKYSYGKKEAVIEIKFESDIIKLVINEGAAGIDVKTTTQRFIKWGVIKTPKGKWSYEYKKER